MILCEIVDLLFLACHKKKSSKNKQRKKRKKKKSIMARKKQRKKLILSLFLIFSLSQLKSSIAIQSFVSLVR
jgi:hypothetical protein